MLVFRPKRVPPGRTQVSCPVPLAALRTPPDHRWCIGTTYVRRQAAPNRRRTRRLAFAIACQEQPAGAPRRCSFHGGCCANRTGEFGTLTWPHFGMLSWPHLRPIVARASWLLG